MTDWGLNRPIHHKPIHTGPTMEAVNWLVMCVDAEDFETQRIFSVGRMWR